MALAGKPRILREPLESLNDHQGQEHQSINFTYDLASSGFEDLIGKNVLYSCQLKMAHPVSRLLAGQSRIVIGISAPGDWFSSFTLGPLVGLGRSQTRQPQSVITHLVLVCVVYVILQLLKSLSPKLHLGVSQSKNALRPLRLLVHSPWAETLMRLTAQGQFEPVKYGAALGTNQGKVGKP